MPVELWHSIEDTCNRSPDADLRRSVTGCARSGDVLEVASFLERWQPQIYPELVDPPVEVAAVERELALELFESVELRDVVAVQRSAEVEVIDSPVQQRAAAADRSFLVLEKSEVDSDGVQRIDVHAARIGIDAGGQ
jgi:hypothetical protein